MLVGRMQMKHERDNILQSRLGDKPVVATSMSVCPGVLTNEATEVAITIHLSSQAYSRYACTASMYFEGILCVFYSPSCS